jgi:hypothetical protein
MHFPEPPRGIRITVEVGALLLSALFIIAASWLLDGVGPSSAVVPILGWVVYGVGALMFYIIRWVALALLGY